MKYIYPNVKIATAIVSYPQLEKSDEYIMRIETTLRKKHRGKWYLIEFFKEHRDFSYEKLPAFIDNFHSSVYRYNILAIISLKLVDMKGERIFKLDPNQEEETERLSKFIFKNK